VFYPDLATECQADSGPAVRAIGWLGVGHSFTVGSVAEAFVERLRAHIIDAWQPCFAAGKHHCEFCTDRLVGGSANIWFPTQRLKFVVPELIVHYIEFHCYRPPDEFIEAVMACPPQGSDEFFNLLSRFQNHWDGRPLGKWKTL